METHRLDDSELNPVSTIHLICNEEFEKITKRNPIFKISVSVQLRVIIKAKYYVLYMYSRNENSRIIKSHSRRCVLAMPSLATRTTMVSLESLAAHNTRGLNTGGPSCNVGFYTSVCTTALQPRTGRLRNAAFLQRHLFLCYLAQSSPLAKWPPGHVCFQCQRSIHCQVSVAGVSATTEDETFT